MNAHKFNPTQNIKTFGAIDVKHFDIIDGSIVDHYLIFANTFNVHKQKDTSILSSGVIYRYEHGKFTPVQILNFEAEVKQFLPVLVSISHFIALVLSINCNSKTKIHQFYRLRKRDSYCWYQWMKKQ